MLQTKNRYNVPLAEQEICDFDDAETPVMPLKQTVSESGVKMRASKQKLVLNSVKIYLLLVVWGIFTVFLMLKEETSSDPRLLTLKPSIVKDYAIPLENVEHLLGLGMLGPFFDHEDSKLQESKLSPNSFVMLQVQQISYYEEKKVTVIRNISERWQVQLVPSQNYEMVRLRTQEHVFKLTPNTSTPDNSSLRLSLYTNSTVDVNIKLWFQKAALDRERGVIYGALVLIFLYIMIIWELVDRTFASMIAAALALGILAAMDARPSLATIVSWIDVETMLLLFGMMVLVGILAQSGIFDYLAVYAYKISRGRIWPLVNSLCLFTAFFSALLDNVTMLMIVSPIIIKLCEALGLDPVLVLMCQVLYSNIGAAGTPVGDPPNIIITTNSFITEHGIHFGNFMLHTLPCVLLVMLQTYIHLRIKYPKDSDLYLNKTAGDEARPLKRASQAEELMRISDKPSQEKLTFAETLAALESTYGIRDRPLLVKSTVAFLFVMALFFLHSVKDLHQLSLGWTAIIGALLLLVLIDVQDMEAVLARVEWSTLLFFASLFILMEALTQLGLIQILGDLVVYIILSVEPGYRLMVALVIIIWISAIASAFLDNIPVTTMMIRIVISLTQNEALNLPLHPLTWALALGACFGGNGTLIGASANVVSAGIAEQHGYKLTFMRFFRLGFPIMLGNVVLTTGYILLAHCVFQWH